MTPHPRGQRLHQLFEVGIMLKGFDGLVELALGVLLLFTNVSNVVQTLVQNEIIEDPNDFFARHAQLLTHLTPHSQFLGALYLLSHGIAKAILAVGLLRGKLWAYPAGIMFFAIFIAYEFIRFIGTHSLLLLAALGFDISVVVLIWLEYRRVTRLPLVQ